MENLLVNCLVRVSTDNQQDFVEWLEYHIAMGFDCIFVFDTGHRGWLDGVCEKYREHVTMVPRNDDWKFKSRMISSYVSRRTGPCWAVCLDDDEFLWLDFQKFRSFKQYMSMVRCEAISIYVKYLSSEHPMVSRVGTLIDCFQHCRPNPQGKVSPNENTPNTAVTLFHVPNNQFRPLRDPIHPTAPNWTDTRGVIQNDAKFNSYLLSDSFEPTAYPLRVYKYALKSGVEMDRKPGTKPVGYTVYDPSMQKAREILLRIPMNANTEELFAKDAPVVEAVNEKRELTPEEIAENEIPVPLARFDSAILNGRTLDEMVKYVCNSAYQDTPEHRKTIERIYNRERRMIIESAPEYRKLHDMLKEGGHTNASLMSALGVGGYALENMKRCLKVLDIDAYDADANITIEDLAPEVPTPDMVAEEAKTKEYVANDDITSLAASYDEQVTVEKQTAEEQQVVVDKEEAKRAKARESRKKYRDKKKAEKEAAQKAAVESAVSPEEKAKLRDLVKECIENETPRPSPEVNGATIDIKVTKVEESPAPSDAELDAALDGEVGEESTNLLDNVDLSAFVNK